MNIIVNNKITVGLVSIALAAMVTITFATTSVVGAQSQDDDEIAQLQSEAARLADLIRQLEGTSTVPVTTTTSVPTTAVPTTVAVSANAACPYAWSRNLTIGSTGDDVLRLQRFLNGNPSTQVSTSGAGSPGSETRYYGPATARAVSAFQELHRAQILTPLNLTRGTGGFYPSTRRRANELCATAATPVATTPVTPTTPIAAPSPSAPTQPSAPSVSGDAVVISAGPTIGDAYALLAAQRVPFTSFVLTAGTDDVRVGTIQIRRVGLSSRDNLDSVAIVDTNGIQYGSAKSLNSRDEVNINAGIQLRARESRTFAVVGNITTDPDEVNSGATVGFEIFNVTADTGISGLDSGNTIRGATHVISTAIDLQSIEVTVDNQSGDVELNEQNEVVVVSVDLQSTTIDGASADEEDAYLKSLILEQKGSADAQEIGSVNVLVEGDEEPSADIMVLDDQYIIVFDGKGLLIEENDEVEISLEVEPTQGSGETVKFVIEDNADVYLIGAATEYGLPVLIADDGGNDYVASNSTISAGTIGSGGRISGFDDEVRYGDNVILGALSVEFEGEEIAFEDVSFSVTIDGLADSNFDDADEDEITIDDIRLTVDGEVVARGDSIEIDRNDVSSGSYTNSGFDFDDSFEITARAERDVEFGIVGDLDSDWSYFDGARIEFTFTGADTIEGLVSDKDYTDSGEYFATDRDFEEVTVRGNQIDFEITAEGVDDTQFVAGAGGVVFATLEVDARDTSDDIEIQNLYITFEGGTSSVDLGDSISSCEVISADGDRVADVRGSLSGSSDQVRFRFNDYVIDAESRENLNVICDIDTSATVGNTFTVAADTNSNDRVEYSIGRDNIDFIFSSRDVSEDIEVAAAGDLDVSLDIPDGEDESGEVLALGDSGTTEASLITVTLEAESEDVRVKDIYLADIDLVGTTNPDNFEAVVTSIDIELGNTGGEDFVSSSETVTGENENGSTDSNRGSATFSNYIQFEDVNEVVEAGEKVEFDLTANFRGINDRRGIAGEILDAASLVVVWEGVDSGTINVTDVSTGGDMREIRVFPAVPVVEADDRTRSFSGGSNRFLYEFTVNGSGGDIYLAQVAFDMSTSSNTTVSDLEVRRGSSTVLGGVTGNISDGVIKVAFDEPEEISESSAKTFRVYGDVAAGSGDNEYINISLAEDSSTPSSNGVNYAASIGNFVWSPNALENDGTTTNNLDWFSGYLVFEESEIGQWDNER